MTDDELSPDEAPRLTLTARSPEDVLAMVPVVLGFAPTDSLVMLTFGATVAFHARVDLPDKPRDVRHVTAVLLEPAARHGVREVILVAYTEHRERAERVTARVTEGFRRAGIEVLAGLRADGARWWHLPSDADDVEDAGTAYDVSAHPFVAEAVWHGLVTLGSRSELAAVLTGDPGAAALTLRRLRALETERPRAGERDRTAEAIWAVQRVRRALADGKPLGSGSLARLLLAVQDSQTRGVLLLQMSRADAQAHLALWTDAVRRSPARVVATPAAIAGFAAWLAGHGALAWCAVDRARQVMPDHRLADTVAGLLEHAVPPHHWDEAVAGLGGGGAS